MKARQLDLGVLQRRLYSQLTSLQERGDHGIQRRDRGLWGLGREAEPLGQTNQAKLY